MVDAIQELEISESSLIFISLLLTDCHSLLFLYCRIDRSRWDPFVSLVNKVDSHVLENAYTRSNWDKMTPLLAALHGKSSANYTWSLNYHKTFTSLLEKHKS